MALQRICITLMLLLHTVIIAQEYSLSKMKRGTSWNDLPGPFAPAGFTQNGEIRAPVSMELRRDLTPANGPAGVCGVCSRVYRVLHDTSLAAQEECRRHNSRQSVLGDITEFYHTLIESRQFNRTLEFPLADRFNRFSFRASFMYLESKRNEPAVLIETVPQSAHVLCVESIRCPEETPASDVATTPAPLPKSLLLDESSDSEQSKSGQEKESSAVSGSNSDRSGVKGEPFWDTLLAGTEPKSWFLATVSLSCLCFFLLIILLISWLYICRMRRLYARRRCRGTCRFGCRCPLEVIRQSVNDAAVFGPLDSQNTQLFSSPLTPQGNGSIRSGSGFGAALFAGGTMTSSRWGSNGGTKLGTPIYVSLANANEKASLMAQTDSCLVGQAGMLNVGSGGLDASNGVGTWGQTNTANHMANATRRRLSQDVICRSTSDGSSVSGHPVSNTASKTMGPNHLRSGLTVGFSYNGNSCTNNGSATVLPPMLISNLNAGQQVMDSIGLYQAPKACYNLSDLANSGGRAGGISPSITQSPTRLGNRKSNDRIYYGLSLSAGSPGPVTEEEESEHPSAFFPQDKFNGSSEATGPCPTYNSYGTDGVQQTNSCPLRESDGDLLNITPPSGFYDPSGSAADSGMVNGSLTSSSMRSHTHNGPNTFGTRAFLPPLNPILSSPTSQTDWKPSPLTSIARSSPAEMVGMIDLEGSSTRATKTNQTTIGEQFSPKLSLLSNMNSDSSTGTYIPQPQNQIPSHRLYTAYERML